MKIKITATSDTHGLHHQLTVPPADIFIHAGDITRFGDLSELDEINQFLGALPCKHKILVPGNHDFCFQSDPIESAERLSNCTILVDQSLNLFGITFYGSPWQPSFNDWAFNLTRGTEIKRKWDLIPMGVHVLITHGPPYGYGDRTLENEVVGCQDLLNAVKVLRPRCHIYGHIHEGNGVVANGYTKFINASACDRWYCLTNPPVTFDYPFI